MVNRVSFGGLENILLVLALGTSPLLISRSVAQTAQPNVRVTQPSPEIPLSWVEDIRIDTTRNLSAEGWYAFRQATGYNQHSARVYTLENVQIPIFEQGKIDGCVNLRIDYLCGERGGSGKLEFIFYLDDAHINTSSGIARIDLFPFSSERTLLSTITTEFDFNQHLGIYNFQPVSERFVESDFLVDRINEIPYAVGKWLKLTRAQVDEVKDLAGFLNQLWENEKHQRDVYDGNQLVGDVAFCNTQVYYGYGKFLEGKATDVYLDEMYIERHVSRSVKAVRTLIETGEESIKGVKVRVTRRDYHPSRFIGRDEHTGTKLIRLNVAELVKGLK